MPALGLQLAAHTAAIALLNNTRISYPNALVLPTFVCASAELCLAHCVNDTNCGAMVFMTPYEPIKV